MEVSELIELALGYDEAPAREAAEQLGAMGVAALPAVLEAVADPWSDPGTLPQALTAIYATAPLGVLFQGIERSEFSVFQSAMQAAAARSEEAIFEAMLGKLEDAGELCTRRAAVADFLGNRGDARALPALKKVFPDAVEQNSAADDPPHFAVATVVALAKLGEFKYGSYLVDLVSDPYPPTRSLAVRGLQIAVGPGMIEALQRASQDSAVEVYLPAIEALFLLRCPAAVDALLAASATDNPEVINNARVYANYILGTEFSEIADLTNWWSGARGGWNTDTCYRSGEPFTTQKLFEILSSTEMRRSGILREILLTTGCQPGDGNGFTQEEVRSITGRLNKAGWLYRWGHAVELAHIR